MTAMNEKPSFAASGARRSRMNSLFLRLRRRQAGAFLSSFRRAREGACGALRRAEPRGPLRRVIRYHLASSDLQNASMHVGISGR